MPGTLHKYELVLLFWEKPIFFRLASFRDLLPVWNSDGAPPPHPLFHVAADTPRWHDGTYNNGTYFLPSKILEDGFSFSAMGGKSIWGKFHHMYLM